MSEHNCFDCGHPVSQHSGQSEATGCAVCDCKRWFVVTPSQQEQPRCGGSGVLSGSGNPYDEDPIVECPGCPDCQPDHPALSKEQRRNLQLAEAKLAEVETRARAAGKLAEAGPHALEKISDARALVDDALRSLATEGETDAK